MRDLAATNTALLGEIAALRSDVGAIEDHARSDLGMVYPDESRACASASDTAR